MTTTSSLSRPHRSCRGCTGSAPHQLLGGVAGRAGRPPRAVPQAVRLAFVVLAFCSGLGLLLYGAFWIVLPPAPEAKPEGPIRSVARYAGGGAGGRAGAVVQRAHAAARLVVPALGAGLLRGGAAVAAGFGDRPGPVAPAVPILAVRLGHRPGRRLRVVAGVSLVIAGAVFILARAGISAVGVGLAAMLITVVGVALITGPWWLRLVRDLSDERRERIRNEERADIAAHLHDSVLQTLALIQRNANSPREVDPVGPQPGTRAAHQAVRRHACPTACSRRRAARRRRRGGGHLRASPSMWSWWGTTTWTPGWTRWSRPAGRPWSTPPSTPRWRSVSVYAELTGQAAEVFVRDRGVGFDPDRIDPTRQGIRGSIVGRLARHARHRDDQIQPGEGTEVQLRLPMGMTRRNAVPIEPGDHRSTTSRSVDDRQVAPTVVLVDDHGMFRAGVRAEIGRAVDIVGEAASVAEAIAVIGTRRARTWCCSTSTCPTAVGRRWWRRCCRRCRPPSSWRCRSPTPPRT